MFQFCSKQREQCNSFELQIGLNGGYLAIVIVIHHSVLGSYEELEQFMRVTVRVVTRVRMRVVGEYFAFER